MGGPGGRHRGTTVAAGMGSVTCVLCNVSPLCFHSYRRLTVALDMWHQHQRDHVYHMCFAGWTAVFIGEMYVIHRN